MKDENNRFEDFFFFFLKLLCTCLAVACMYLAYDLYNQKKIDSAVDELVDNTENLFESIFDSLK